MGSLKGYTIAYKSLGAGLFDYSFTIDNEFFSHFENSEIIGGNCSVEVQLERGETMLEIDVTITGEVMVECDRCLDPCPVAVDYDGLLVVKFSSEIDLYDGEIMWLSPAESEVDLSQYLYESIVLGLPYQRLHAEGECNQEMINKLNAISPIKGAEATGAEATGAEAPKEAGAEVEAEADEEVEKEETHGLSQSDLAKLQALKEMMEKK